MTSYKDLQPKQIKEVPFTNIGAQDLCSIEQNWKGTLRKEGQLERGLKKLKSNLQWRQYFAVLSQGCVYVFHDEHSGSPKTQFSLSNYKKLQRNFSTPHSFDIIPSTGDGKIYRFSCTTDTERLDWMRALYVSLLAVHKLPLPESDTPKTKVEEYNLIESETGVTSTSNDALYEIEDRSSDDDIYDKPEEIPDPKPPKLSKPKNKYAPDPTSFKYKTLEDTKPKASADLQRSGSLQSHTYTESYSDCASKPTQRSNSLGDIKIDLPKCEDTVSPTSKRRPKVAPKPEKPKYINSDETKRPRRFKSPTPSTKPSKSPEPPELQLSKDSVTKSDPAESTVKSQATTKTQFVVKSLGKTKSESTVKSPGTQPPKEDTKYKNIGECPYVEPETSLDPDSEYMFDGDKADTARILEIEEERTFLIRDSSEPGKKVLVVKTCNGLKSFKIEKLGEKLLIEAGVLFGSYHEFVEHYKRHKLPNINMQLKLGYNKKFFKKYNPEDDDYEPVAEPVKHK